MIVYGIGRFYMPTNLLQGTYGISNATLEDTNVSASDVKSGIRFMSPNGTIETGTLSLHGNATTSDVVSGKTFYSNGFTMQTGDLDTRTFIAFGKVWCNGGFHPNISYNPDYVDITQNQWSISYTYTFKKACNIYLNSVSYTDRGAAGTYWICTIKKNADTLFSIGPYASGSREYPYATTLQMNVGDTITIERNSNSEGSTIDMVMYTTV